MGALMSPREFAVVAERHRHELYVYCRRRLGSADQAEDAVQDTLLRAWRGRARLERAESVRAWLYTIARNVCFDRMTRDAGRETPSDGAVSEEPAGADSHSEVVERETIELTVLAAIDLLPPRQRDAVILCDLFEFRPAEAAGLLGTGVTAVNSALQRARRTLRERLDVERRESWSAAAGGTQSERQIAARLVDAVA